jgi:hypothetical protein
MVLREFIVGLAVVMLGLCVSRTLAGDAALEAGAADHDFAASDDMVIGGGIGPGRVKGQEGKLRAVATVLRLGETRLALVACDVLMVRRDVLDVAAERIEKELGIPAQNVLINATHTHHAPTTVTIHGYERDEGFCAQVRDGVVEAVRKASARLGTGAAVDFLFRLGEESSVGQNSRLLLADGTIYWVGKRDDAVRPTGPFDPELPVLAFRRREGGMESLIFNHSTHLIGVQRPGVRSPGFYGLAAQDLERELGGKVTFLAGAYGSTHNLTLGGEEMVYRISAAVREALSKAEVRPVGVLRSLKRELRYRVRRFDEAAEDAAVSFYCQKRVGGDPSDVIEVFRKMRRELAAHQGEERTTWLQVLRIGDVAVVGVPGEFFTALGIEIKRRSPFRYTYVAGTANDYIGYIPDARGFELGGYQVWTGFHSLVEKGTGEAIVEEAVKMLGEVEGK